MSLLSLFKAPRLNRPDDVMIWSKAMSDFLDNRTGQLILPFGIVTLVNGLNTDIRIPPLTYLAIVGPSAAFQIGGMAGGMLGRIIILENTSGHTMTLNNHDAGSEVNNQIENVVGGNVNCSIALLIHGAVGSRWVLVAAR